ncbi:2-oxoacid:acceptor oxidoreductase subunit alpha [bacterium]|nr:2-oxoacid:acceptor oxidoreductase subunit alpha [bacterium]
MSVDLAIGVVGTGGDGVILLGELLAKAAAKVGLNAVLTKSFGSQIRGGESSSRIRVTDWPTTWGGDKIDALMLFRLSEFGPFKDELILKRNALIIVDAEDETPAGEDSSSQLHGDNVHRVPFAAIALKTARNKQAKNMVMAGVACELFNWPAEGVREFIEERFAKYGGKVVQSSLAAVEAGREYVRGNIAAANGLRIEYERREPQMFLSGNEAFSFGALSAGCRFMAGYPINPATDILDFMGRQLPRYGGACVQAEDEISAMCMVLGASFGGVKALTATSGPGLSLKQEAIGLAAMAELPVVICDVQRGGPSTGLPTRTEQSDLNSAVYGGHGDSPRVVLAPTSIAGCYELAFTAFEIAERYQTPVIVLLDQHLGYSKCAMSGIKIRGVNGSLDGHPELPWRCYPTPEQLAEPYKRYALTDSGVSPMAVPGMPGGEYMASGIEHFEDGGASTSQKTHQQQSEKRLRKIEQIAKEYELVEIAGAESPSLGILTWGSAFGVCEEACRLLTKAGLPAQVLAPRIIHPLPERRIEQWLSGVSQLVMVETSIGEQFYRHLKGFVELPRDACRYYRAGGVPISLGEVLGFIIDKVKLPSGFKHEVIEEHARAEPGA